MVPKISSYADISIVGFGGSEELDWGVTASGVRFTGEMIFAASSRFLMGMMPERVLAGDFIRPLLDLRLHPIWYFCLVTCAFVPERVQTTTDLIDQHPHLILQFVWTGLFDPEPKRKMVSVDCAIFHDDRVLTCFKMKRPMISRERDLKRDTGL